MKRERYKESIRVVVDDRREYEVQYFVTMIDDKEGAPFYRLTDGIPVRRISDNEFEIGMVDKVRAKRR